MSVNNSSQSTKNKQELIDLANADWNPQLVRINDDAIAETQMTEKVSLPNFDYLLDAKAPLDEKAMLWIYCASQAFQFWSIDPEGNFERYHYNDHTGSFAMFSKIRDFWKSMTVFKDSTLELFQGTPSGPARISIGNELSRQMDQVYFASQHIIAAAHRKSLGVAEASYLAKKFPISFNDPYLKKAQLAVFAIGRLVEEERDIKINYDLTAFADYQVPRVLRAMGVLEYSEALAHAVDSGAPIEAGSEFERSIRGATIVAVEKIAKAKGYSAAVIDNILWNNQSLAKDALFHRTITSNY